MIEITDQIAIDEKAIQIEFVRSSGPGGQNVNKVSTAVQLRYDSTQASLPDGVVARLEKLAGSRMTQEGVLIIEARQFRTQEQNRQDALDRLVSLLKEAAKKPRPRKKTKPSASSIERRLESKHRRSDTKRHRRWQPGDGG